MIWAAIVFASAAIVLICRWGQLKTRTSTDYFLAGRRLGPWLTAASQIGNAGLLWVLIVLVEAAYRDGLAAVWSGLALLLGYALSWHYLAPRLQALSIQQHSITVGQIVAANLALRKYHFVLSSLALVISAAVLIMTAARWQAATALLNQDFSWPIPYLLACGAAAMILCLMTGGYWAASLLEAILTGLMLLLMLVLTCTAVAQWPDFTATVATTANKPPQEWMSTGPPLVALAFMLGMVSAGLAEVGQPQALTRFLAMRDSQVLRVSRRLALAALLGLVAGGLIVGWCARRLLPGLETGQLLVPALAARVFPTQLAALSSLIVAAYLMLSVGSTWLSAVSAWVVDLRKPNAGSATALWLARLVVMAVGVAATALAWYASTHAASPLQRLELGWQLLGASLGPWLLVRVSGKRIRAGATLGAIWTGCALTLIFHAMPDAPGDYLEHVLPFIAALGIALTGGEQRGDPDREDRQAMATHHAGN